MSNGRAQQFDPEEQSYRLNVQTSVNGWTLGGDCPALRDYLAPKEGAGWGFCRLCVAYFRGFAQTAFANNPITGVICMISLAILGPGTFVACATAGLIGFLVSILIREPAVIVENGLTVFNPLIYGAVSYYFVPVIYGGFDGFSLLLMFFGIIFITYLWRACAHGVIPCLTLPFNLAELILLFTLKNVRSTENPASLQLTSLDNVTAIGAPAATSFVANSTLAVSSDGDALDWGMIFRGTVASASQLYVVDSVPMGAITYLAVLIYSPTTCFFGYLGALLASLIGLQVGAPPETVYAGLWGFNGYLTGACLGGSFLVLNLQTAAATAVATVFTGFMQHLLQLFLQPYGIPCGTFPFVLSVWLFIGLGKASEGAFFYPVTVSFPEAQRQEHLTLLRVAQMEQVYEMRDPPETLLRNDNGKAALT